MHIMRTMDILSSHYDEYIRHLFEKSGNILRRDTSVCFCDYTNYYFETETEDEDYVDEVTGEMIRGLRKYGPSKEHRPGPGSLKIRNFNSMGERAFIVTQSIKKLSDRLKKAVFNDYDYRLLSSDLPVTIESLKDFDRFAPDNEALYKDKACKIIEADSAFDLGLYEEKQLKNGRTRRVKSKAVVKQKVIITFSRKMMEYQRRIRNRQIEREEKMLAVLNPETYKKGPHDVTRFIWRTSITKTREKAEDIYEIDRKAIEEEEKYDGYYAVATLV